jgi:hypothetical protein
MRLEKIVGVALAVLVIPFVAQAQSNPLTFQTHAADAFFYAKSAVFDTRQMILYDSYTPSTVTPVVSSLDTALDNITNARAVIANISNLGGFGYPAPQGITDPIAYAKTQIQAAQSNLSTASSRAQGLPASSDLTTLLNTDVPNAQNGLTSALSDLNALTNPVALPTTTTQGVLFFLYSADNNLSSTEVQLLVDVAANNTTPGTAACVAFKAGLNASQCVMRGLWQTLGWPRNLVDITFSVLVGVNDFTDNTTHNGYVPSAQPHGYCGNTLLYPGVSPEDHGVPYFFRDGTNFATGNMSTANANYFSIHLSRAWVFTDFAGDECLQDFNGAP